MRNLLRILAATCLFVLALWPAQVTARPPMCDGSAGSCTWEVGSMEFGGGEAFYWMLSCPNGGGAFYLISEASANGMCGG